MGGGASEPRIVVDSVWKVFGARHDEAIALSREGVSRSDVLESTGCTVGVRDVSFEVRPGETFVVMGLSGSGKSTLVRCLSGLTDVTAGSVRIDGDDVTSMTPTQLRDLRRSKLSMVFQHFGLFPHRRVIDNAAFGLEVQGVSKTERRERAIEVLDIVGLAGFEHHYPQQLSGGMQQRVGLARAIAVDPEVLFFDEPFSALDPLIRRDMQDELVRLQDRLQRTLVFITHDFAEAIKLGDRIAIMKDGVLDQIGSAAELIRSPATDYVREFVRDIPKTKVLTVRDVMQVGEGGEQRVHADVIVEQLLPQLLTSDAVFDVFDDSGQSIGVVDRAAVVALLEEQV